MRTLFIGLLVTGALSYPLKASELLQRCREIVGGQAKPTQFVISPAKLSPSQARVFLNIETTGLNLHPRAGERSDRILEIALGIVDPDFNLLDVYSSPVHYEAADLSQESFNPFAWDMHQRNKLVLDILHGKGQALEAIETQIIAKLTPHLSAYPDGKIPLYGIKVDFDRGWIEKHLPRLAQIIFYQDRDVISVRHFMADALGVTAQKRDYGPRALDEVLDGVIEYHTYIQFVRGTSSPEGGSSPTAMDRRMTLATYESEGPISYDLRTRNAPIGPLYRLFESLLPPGKTRKILDAGCAAGRDIEYFYNQGYEVTGYDGAPSFVSATKEWAERLPKNSQHPQPKIFYSTFENFNAEGTFDNQLDGIWAMSSTATHSLTRENFIEVHRRHLKAVRPGGIMYLSLPTPKPGEVSGFVSASLSGPEWSQGRAWTLLTKEELRELLIETFGEKIEILHLSDAHEDQLDRNFLGLGKVLWTQAIIRRLQ